MDPLDDLLEQLGDVDEEETATNPEKSQKCVEIDLFAPEFRNNREETSPLDNQDQKEKNDESDDEELYIHRRELSEQGMQLDQWLKKNSSTSGATSKDAWKSSKKSVLTGFTNKHIGSEAAINGIVNFDKFQISVRNPKVSSQNFGMFTAGMRLEKLSLLKGLSTFKESWCTLAVIVEKGITKKSANGNEYLIWKIHDLKDCQSQPVKLLMFGDAIKEHWKLPLGNVIALMSPQLSDDTSVTSKKLVSFSLKVSKSSNIVEIGQSAHFGTCKGTRQQDGQKCSNFVNTSLSEYCVYHVMSAARKLSSNRGTFNAVTCGPNMGRLSKPVAPKTPSVMSRTMPNVVNSTKTSLRDTMRPANSNSFSSPSSNLKTTTKEEEKIALEDILNKNKNSFAARQMLKLKEKKEDKNAKLDEFLNELSSTKTVIPKPEKRAECFGDFLKNETEKEKAKTIDLGSNNSGNKMRRTKLWSSSMMEAKKPMGSRDAQEHAARLRAIAILRKQKVEASKNGSLKRKASEDSSSIQNAKKLKTDSSVSNKMDEIKKLLARKSIHQAEAEKEEGDRLQAHLSSLEEREKVETFTTTCTSVKNVKVVTCNECKYTAQTANNTCIEKGHKLVKHEAEKRFFKCAGCKKRTICFEIMPIKHCSHCNENKWLRVAMRDERKVVLDTENLHLRGEERKFVTS